MLAARPSEDQNRSVLLLEEGNRAYVTVFDPDTVAEVATYNEPASMRHGHLDGGGCKRGGGH